MVGGTKLQKPKNYKYAWITSAGKVFLRKEQANAAILVSDKTDLDKLSSKYI